MFIKRMAVQSYSLTASCSDQSVFALMYLHLPCCFEVADMQLNGMNKVQRI